MSFATRFLRSIGLLGAVLLGIATSIGSGGGHGLGDLSDALSCGGTIHAVDSTKFPSTDVWDPTKHNANSVDLRHQSPVAKEPDLLYLGWEFDNTIANQGASVTAWYRLDPLPGSAWTAVNQSVLTINSVVFKRDNDAQFQAKVTFTCNGIDHVTWTDPVTLIVAVAGAASWVDVDSQGASTQPADVTVALGATANFIAMAYGDNTYQWQRSNATGPPGWTSLARPTGRWRWPTCRPRMHLAQFKLIATNRSGGNPIESRAATLSISNLPPSFDAALDAPAITVAQGEQPDGQPDSDTAQRLDRQRRSDGERAGRAA